MKNEINTFDATIKKNLPAVPYILCPIYGLDVNAYNKLERVYRYQDVLDAGIVKANAWKLCYDVRQALGRAASIQTDPRKNSAVPTPIDQQEQGSTLIFTTLYIFLRMNKI